MRLNRLIFIILLSLSSRTFGQNDKVLFMCNREIDTLTYTQENLDRNKFYNVPELELLNDEYIFRSWAGNSCIEIIRNGNKLSGKVYFAVEGENSKRFTKSYKLSNKVTENLFSLVNGYQFKRRENKEIAVVHTFEIKDNANIEIYTTDSPQFEYKIWDIVKIDKYWNIFDKENPFKKYTYWELIQTGKALGQDTYYLTKGNE